MVSISPEGNTDQTSLADPEERVQFVRCPSRALAFPPGGPRGLARHPDSCANCSKGEEQGPYVSLAATARNRAAAATK